MKFFATTARGTEGALKEELREIGLRHLRGARGGVWFEGEMEAGMRACLWSRIAMRVLLHLASAEAKGEEGLYEAIAAIPWEEHLNVRSTFAVDASVKSSALTHSKYVALKTKDAVVDRMRQVKGSRPDVDVGRPDVPIVVHLSKDVVDVNLDLSGEPLHRRGWRVEATEAPLRETLAAAMLRIGGFDSSLPMCDPMCGSGTLVIEAALAARRIAPGRGRHFAFHRWPTFSEADQLTFKLLQEEARDAALPSAPAPIVARDRFAAPLEVCARNAQRAGVAGSVVIERRDVRDLAPLPSGCQLFLNPPYGERLGAQRLQLSGLYRGIGEAFASLPSGHRMVVLAGTPLFEQSLAARPVSRHELFNGPIEARLFVYERP